MALWTFDFYVLPKPKFPCGCIQNDDFDKIISWMGFSVHENPFNRLSSFFTETTSWSNDIVQFGKTDSTHIQLLFDGSDISEISCSIDLRSIAISDIEIIVEFMQSINSTMFYKNYVYEVSMHNLITLIRQSHSFAFCKNPIVYIDGLDNQR